MFKPAILVSLQANTSSAQPHPVCQGSTFPPTLFFTFEFYRNKNGPSKLGRPVWVRHTTCTSQWYPGSDGTSYIPSNPL